MRVCFITDDLIKVLGSNRPAYAWCSELVKGNVPCSIVTGRGTSSIISLIKGSGIDVRVSSGGGNYDPSPYVLFLKTAINAAIKRVNVGINVDALSDCDVIVNTSNQHPVASDVYYFQGFLSDLMIGLMKYSSYVTLKAGSLPGLLPSLIIDSRWVKAMRGSRLITANSSASARMLTRRGLPSVVVYPPIQGWLLEAFMEIDEEGSYALFYVGKEFNSTWFRVVYEEFKPHISDWRWFGARHFTPPHWLKAEYIGYVPEPDLPKAVYAGAKLVITTNVHEPFGYVNTEAVLAGKPTIAIGPRGEGPWEQWAVLKYPVTWLPPGFKPKVIEKVDSVSRFRVYQNHHPLNTLPMLLPFIRRTVTIPHFTQAHLESAYVS